MPMRFGSAIASFASHSTPAITSARSPPPPARVLVPLPLATVAVRAAPVRREHDETAVRQELRRRVPPAEVLAGRAAVDVDDRPRHRSPDGLRVRDVQE